MTPQEVRALELPDAQEEMLWLIQNSPMHELPSRHVPRKLLNRLQEMRLVYVKNGFVGLNGAGLAYYNHALHDRHDFTPSVMLHWALDVLERYVGGDADKVGIGAEGRARGNQGASAPGADVVAGLRRFVDKKF